MNILIVDDEFYSAKSTQKKISEHYADRFEQVLCAFSAEQALKICEKIDISILICDIEMPGGSGLSLLTTLRDRGIDVICIFLTAYAKFEYVSEALKLDSIDYLLKPIVDESLFASVDKAMEAYRTKQTIKQSLREAEILDSNRQELENFFWMELLNGNIKSNYTSISSERSKRGLHEISEDCRYHLLLVETAFRTSSIPMEKDLFEFVIRNVLSEFFYDRKEPQTIISPRKGSYLLPLPAWLHDRESILAKCGEALQGFVLQFPSTFIFYLGAASYPITELAATVQEMLSVASKNVSPENHIFDLAKTSSASCDVTDYSFPEAHWKDLLLRKDSTSLLSEADIYLTGLRHSGSATKDSLRFFYRKFLLLLVSGLEKLDPAILDDFNAKALRYQEDDVTSSFYLIREWVQNILALYDECTAGCTEEEQPVLYVRNYIKSHLDEDLSREKLAGLVYLTPDYLSHLFKKEVHISLTNYVIKERIEESKKLLANTNLSIQDIAIQCGFQNISYFSRQFRNITGMTPREFRK